MRKNPQSASTSTGLSWYISRIHSFPIWTPRWSGSCATAGVTPRRLRRPRAGHSHLRFVLKIARRPRARSLLSLAQPFRWFHTTAHRDATSVDGGGHRATTSKSGSWTGLFNHKSSLHREERSRPFAATVRRCDPVLLRWPLQFSMSGLVSEFNRIAEECLPTGECLPPYGRNIPLVPAAGPDRPAAVLRSRR